MYIYKYLCAYVCNSGLGGYRVHYVLESEAIQLFDKTKSGHFRGVRLASLYLVGYLIGGVTLPDWWRHWLASAFTIHQLHDYAVIQSALLDDETCMASICGVMLYPAFISCGVTYDPRVEVRAPHLRPE